jgi:hypothetical protein
MYCTIWVDPNIQRGIYEEITGKDLKHILPPFHSLHEFHLGVAQHNIEEIETLFQMFPFNTDGVDFHGRFEEFFFLF